MKHVPTDPNGRVGGSDPAATGLDSGAGWTYDTWADGRTGSAGPSEPSSSDGFSLVGDASELERVRTAAGSEPYLDMTATRRTARAERSPMSLGGYGSAPSAASASRAVK
jgi:hypothetical protein